MTSLARVCAAIEALGVEPRPPLAEDQAEIERDGHRTICRVLVRLTRTVRVDFCGVPKTLALDGTVGADGYRVARMG